MPDFKPILCLDFDGVLHSYTSRWTSADEVLDPPVPGAMGFLLGAVKRFRVVVFSSRSGEPGGVEAMRDWLVSHAVLELDEDAHDVYSAVEFSATKPPALVTLDDRALTFDGTWPDLDTLANFRPWNRR